MVAACGVEGGGALCWQLISLIRNHVGHSCLFMPPNVFLYYISLMVIFQDQWVFEEICGYLLGRWARYSTNV